MSERMVEVWLNRKNLDDFINEKECEGYTTEGVNILNKKDIYARCSVPAVEIDDIKNNKIYIRAKRSVSLESPASSPRGGCIK